MLKNILILSALLIVHSTVWAGGALPDDTEPEPATPVVITSSGGDGGASIICLPPTVERTHWNQSEEGWQVTVDFLLQQRTPLWSERYHGTPLIKVDGSTRGFEVSVANTSPSRYRANFVLDSELVEAQISLPHLDPEEDHCQTDIRIDFDAPIANASTIAAQWSDPDESTQMLELLSLAGIPFIDDFETGPDQAVNKALGMRILKAYLGQPVADWEYDLQNPTPLSKVKASRDLATHFGTKNLDIPFREHFRNASRADIFNTPNYSHTPLTWAELLRLIEFYQ